MPDALAQYVAAVAALPAAIRAAREAAGLSIADLADRLGCSRR